MADRANSTERPPGPLPMLQDDSSLWMIVANLSQAAHVAARHERNLEAQRAAAGVMPTPRNYEFVAKFVHSSAAEDFCVPAIDGTPATKPERALRKSGWRFLAVPSSEDRKWYLGRLNWDVSSWLAIPPEALGMAARPFQEKGQALAWAETQGREALA